MNDAINADTQDTPLEQSSAEPLDTNAVPEEQQVSTEEPGSTTVDAQQPPETPAKVSEPLPADVAKLLRELRQANPASQGVAKALQDSYYRSKAYADLFENIDNARGLKANLEAIGGTEGLVHLQEDSQTLTKISEMALSGNPQFIDDLATDAPEGFKKLVPIALDRFSRIDQEGFSKLMRPYYVKELMSTNLGDYVGRALDMLQAGHADLAQRELGAITRWLQGLAEESKQPVSSTAPPAAAPETKTQATEAFSQQLVSLVSPWLVEKVGESLKPLTQSRALSKEALEDLNNGVVNALDSELGKDADYQRQLGILRNSGDAERASRYVKLNAERLIQKLANRVFSVRYGNKPTPKGQAAKATGQSQAPAAPATMVRIPQAPRPENVDMSRTSSQLFMKHQAYLKDGRLVSWPWV